MDLNGTLAVEASRPFVCNGHDGTLLAIIALADYSLSCVQQDSNLYSRIRTCAKWISDAAARPDKAGPGMGKGGSGYNDSVPALLRLRKVAMMLDSAHNMQKTLKDPAVKTK